MLIKVNNPTKECRELTALSDRVIAGDSALPVLNTDGFTANAYIVLRKLGDEQAELLQVSSVSAGTLNLTSSVSRAHHVGAQIYVIGYNQVEISRKTSASGSFSELTTIDLQPDQLQTVYDDTQGQTTYFYRMRFKNETTGQFSDYSATIEGTGASTRQAGTMIDLVLHRTNDEGGDYTTRSSVLNDLNLAYQQIYNAFITASSEFYLGSLEVPTEDFKHEYTLPDDFKEISLVRDGNGDIVPPTKRTDSYAFHGYELTGRNKLYLIDVPEPASTDTVTPLTILSNNAYDESGTWTASLDATNVTTDTDEFKVGSGSINFDVDVSADAGNVAALTNSTFTAVDLSDYEDTGRIRLWLYLPDVTHTSTVTLRWGSDSSNYWSLAQEKDYKDHAFHDGWNLIEFNWADSAVTETGTPDSAAVDYLQLRIAYTASQPDDEDFRLDAITIANTWNSNSVYEVLYFKQPAIVANEMTSFDIPEGYQYLMVDYAVAQILLRQGEKDTLANRLLKQFEANVSKLISQSAKRTRRVIGFSHGYRRNYRHGASDSTTIVHSDGNITRL